MRTNLGRVSPLPRGVWEDSASYSKGDIVRRADAAYIALQESSGVEPGASAMWTQYWKLIASDGNQADLELLTKSLSLANVVIGMQATAESVPFGSPIAVFSSADPTQNSLSLHFQIPRNSEFVFPPVVASMYSYNGTVLPALPAWDKETYPYAVIQSSDSTNYYLYVTGSYRQYNDFTATDEWYSFLFNVPMLYAKFTLGDEGWSAWKDFNETFPTSTGVEIGGIKDYFIWTNTNLYYGEVLAYEASNPVPVQLVGYSYNGTVLPKLPEWDKTAYPYAYIGYQTMSLGTMTWNRYYLYVSTQPFFVKPSGYTGTIEDGHAVVYMTQLDMTLWKDWDAYETNSESLCRDPTWANYDMFNEDGTLFLSASDPVPVYE